MKEPGNLIFEFATAGPGFTIDESVDDLGRQPATAILRGKKI